MPRDEARLHLAEHHFRTAFAESPIGMCLVDRDDRFRMVNDAFCEIVGYSSEQLLKLTFHDLTHPDDLDGDRRQRDRLMAGEIQSYQFEKRYCHRRGPVRWVNVSVSLVRDDAGAPLHRVAHVTDITAAKQAECSLREVNARLQAIFDNVPAWISLRALDGRFLDVNAQLAKIVGKPKEQLLGTHPGEHLRTQTISDLEADDHEVWETRRAITREVSVTQLGGRQQTFHTIRYPVLDESGDVSAIGSFGLDITDRKRAEAARDRALAAFAEAQRIASLGSWTWDASTDTAEWSDEMYRLFGRDPAAGPATSMELFGYIARPDRRHLAEAFRKLFAGAPSFELDYRIVAGDGAERMVHGLGYRDPDNPGFYSGIVQDVTELRAVELDVRAAQERFRRAFEHAPVGMAISGLAGHFVQVNDSLCAITGYSRAELLATSVASITHPEDADERGDIQREIVAGDSDPYQREVRFLRANGDTVWVSLHVSVLRDRKGHPEQLLAQVVDITERRRVEKELRHLADHDPLTGLLNRRGLEAELERHVKHVNRYGERGALLVLDLDRFKSVNDTLGHDAGDQLIVSVATLLRNRLRSSDAIARFGGDEFAVLLPDADATVAEHVAAEMVADIQQHAFVVKGQARRHVTASIGVTMFRQGMATGEEALVNADLAMYDAKEAGRDRVSIHAAERQGHPRLKTRLAWIERIREALDDGRMTLHAQPVLELQSGQVHQHELLVRMLAPSGDSIPPGAFLFIAERYDLVQELDRWVVKRAIELLGSDEEGERTDALEINVSGKSLGDDQLLELIESELQRSGVDPSRLIFEVTETAAIANISLARGFAESLKALGCRFALDDFGAGFGSFYYLKHIPFDFLKIDGEFITGCRSNRTDQLIIESLVAIARGLNKQTIAEGVEDHQTELFLRRNGVDFAQGYHIGRPVPVADRLPAWSGL